MKILPDKRGWFFISHLSVVGGLAALGIVGEGGFLIELPFFLLTFPLGTIAVPIWIIMHAYLIEGVFLRAPELAYLTTGSLFAVLAANSWLWAYRFLWRTKRNSDSKGLLDAEPRPLEDLLPPHKASRADHLKG